MGIGEVAMRKKKTVYKFFFFSIRPLSLRNSTMMLVCAKRIEFVKTPYSLTFSGAHPLVH